MNILYIQGDYNFCYYYRGYLPGVYSNQQVISEFINSGTTQNAEELTKKAMRADIVCFQRPTGNNSLQLAKLLKSKGKYIIMDNDDTYSGIPLHRLGNNKQVEIAKELNNNLNEFCKIAHGITTSTEILKEEYSKINKNTVVLKNTIDPNDEFKCKVNITSKFRIGFIGSVTTNDDYFHIKEQIKQLDDRNDITIVVMGVKLANGKLLASSMQEDLDFWQSLNNVEWHPLCNVTDYMYNISKLALDLVIIPRKDHYFNKCKSNLKFLEMSLLRIPVLAQSFSDGLSPYQQNKDYCTLVTDNNEWYNMVVEIKNNHEKYRRLANKAHDYVLENYSIKNYASEWQKQIEILCKYPKNI